MWRIGIVMRGMIDMVMMEWERQKLIEEGERKRIVDIDFVRADDGWYGNGLIVGWKVWWIKKRSWWKTKMLLRQLRRRKKFTRLSGK